MPSMPLRFWDETDGQRYRQAYFALTEHGSITVHGRSDATLNRHGIRMGSADLTDPVERLPQVREAMVTGVQEEGGGYYMPMFVALGEGIGLDATLSDEIRQAVRRSTSPRHVPDDVIAVPAIPHTRTGKKLEIPIRRILRGDPPDQCLDPAGVDDPDLIAWYADLGVRLRAARGQHLV